MRSRDDRKDAVLVLKAETEGSLVARGRFIGALNSARVSEALWCPKISRQKGWYPWWWRS